MSCMIVSIPFANHSYLLNILQIIAFKNHWCIKRFDRQYILKIIQIMFKPTVLSNIDILNC